MEQITRGTMFQTLDYLPFPKIGPLEKAAIHYAAGDKDGGDKYMNECARGTAVSLGGTIGNMAGPACGPGAAMLGGCVFDTVQTFATNKPTGYVKDAIDITRGTDPIASGLQMGSRMLNDAYNGGIGTEKLCRAIGSSLFGD